MTGIGWGVFRSVTLLGSPGLGSVVERPIRQDGSVGLETNRERVSRLLRRSNDLLGTHRYGAYLAMTGSRLCLLKSLIF